MTRRQRDRLLNEREQLDDIVRLAHYARTTAAQAAAADDLSACAHLDACALADRVLSVARSRRAIIDAQLAASAPTLAIVRNHPTPPGRAFRSAQHVDAVGVVSTGGADPAEVRR